eukprot:TRINITY_DN6059_c0_g1_i4.p3 TRINITY_DN6059_c0_g1~~TRINITY_DN6059_c0_g1_i4.p3  ORF type:complete len:126 (-),score=6.21 TRINITY_DN6059_c0_g1_i4:5-382(-)
MGYAQFGRTDGYPYLFAALADVVDWLDRQEDLRRTGQEIRNQAAIWERINQAGPGRRCIQRASPVVTWWLRPATAPVILNGELSRICLIAVLSQRFLSLKSSPFKQKSQKIKKKKLLNKKDSNQI